MAEQTKLDSPPPKLEDGDANEIRAAARGRSEYVIAFGVVALVAMIFGFLLGLMF
jgi:hypothetical protein